MNKKIKGIIIGLMGLVAIITGFNSCTSVKSGHTGIKVKFGAVQQDSIPEGLNFKFPFIEKIVLMDNRTQKTKSEGNSASKDMQTVDYKVAVNFRVLPEKSAKLYQKVGENYAKTIISPAIQESTKSIIANYTAEGLIQNRQEVSEKINNLLSKKLESYGIQICSISLENLEFSQEFNQAIEAKQTAEQEALKSQAETVKVQEEAKQKVIKAQAESDANNLLSNSIDKNILIQKYIEKWNGELPKVSSDSNSMLNIGDLLK